MSIKLEKFLKQFKDKVQDFIASIYLFFNKDKGPSVPIDIFKPKEKK